MDEVDEEKIAFENHCFALVSSGKHEPFLRRLFQTPAGSWTTLVALAAAAPSQADGTASNAWANWTPAPTPEDGSFVVIVFYDFSTNLSLVACSNRSRLSRPRRSSPTAGTRTTARPNDKAPTDDCDLIRAR